MNEKLQQRTNLRLASIEVAVWILVASKLFGLFLQVAKHVVISD